MNNRLQICYNILFGILSCALWAQPPSIGGLETKVDSIMSVAIQQKAFPGGQLLLAKEGEIVFHKAYGYHTYDSIRPTRLNDLYDLASVTKILGPLPALMKLYEEGKIDLDQPFSKYWKPWRRKKDKADLTLREILAHQAGLRPYIVFLNDVMKKGEFRQKYIRHQATKHFNQQAYDQIYVKDNFKKKIYKSISKSEVSKDKTYRYSGLAFLIFPELIQNLSGHSYEYYLQKHFYGPVGASSLVFKPKTKGYPNAIVPTELDTLYRKSLVQGWVHDENASLMGGVSGNAGLFGSARDVYNMMQLYQNYGAFNGQQILNEKTVKEFSRIQYPENENRRGLGFDKPLINNSELAISEAYPAPASSPESFGHSGFTGTFVWADPKYQMVFIFLSNRVYPNRNHRNLYDLNIRTSLQQLFYEHLIRR